MPNCSADGNAPTTPTPRTVVLTDLLGDTATASVTYTHAGTSTIAAYHPGHLTYDQAADVLHAMIDGPLRIIDARQGALR